MKKIRLTESQLIDLIKKSVNKVKTINESRIINEVTTISAESLAQIAKNLKTNMGGEGIWDDVQAKHLKAAYANISAMKDWVWEDGTCAVDKLLAYYKTYKGEDFLTSLNGASESKDPEFDDLKAKLPKLITQLQQSCAAAKKKDTDDAAAKTVALSSCASKEPGFVQYTNKISFGVPLGKKGYITAYNDGRDMEVAGKNIAYWEYAKFHKGKTEDVLLARTKGTCVNGVLNLDAWVKI